MNLAEALIALDMSYVTVGARERFGTCRTMSGKKQSLRWCRCQLECELALLSNDNALEVSKVHPFVPSSPLGLTMKFLEPGSYRHFHT